MKAKRAHLTKREHDAMHEKQGGLCGCGCGYPLDYAEGVVEEHVWEFVALGNAGKPDKLYRKPCADAKTFGPRGDLNTISHIKQLAEGRTQADRRKKRGYGLIRSRGFDKTKTKKMNGEVVRRG